MQKTLKIIFPYGNYRITNSIKLKNDYMINFEGEHSAFNGEILPSRTLASTIYLDVEDDNIAMFESENESMAQIGGQISNMGFMSYKGSFYGKPKNIFMKKLRCAYRGFHLDRCLISQFNYVWYDGSLGGGTLIKNNQIRGIGKAVCSNTIIGDAQIFHNYFNGFMNDDGEQIIYPDFIDKDRQQTTLSLSQINDNWFEFFRYVFIKPTKMQFTGNLFDYCCRIIDNCGFNVLFEGNILNNSTKKLITNAINGRNRVNNMFKDESYVNINIWGSGVSIVNSIIGYALDESNDTYFIEIEGYMQTGTINNIKMIGNNGGEFTFKPKYLFKNSNKSYAYNDDNLNNLVLKDYADSICILSELSDIYPLNVVKNNRFMFSKLRKSFTPIICNTDSSIKPITHLQLIDDNGHPSLYANDNLVPKFTESSWVKGGALNFIDRQENFIKVESNRTGSVDIKTTLSVSQGFYRFNSQPSLEGVDYTVALRIKDSSGKTLRTIYPTNKNDSNELFFFIVEGEEKLELTLAFVSTTVGDESTFIRPSITRMSDNPIRTIIQGSSYNGNNTLYAIKHINGQIDFEEFFK